MTDDEKKIKGIRLFKFIKRYPDEWLIVCGLKDTTYGEAHKAMELLEKHEFYELAMVIAERLGQIILESNIGDR